MKKTQRIIWNCRKCGFGRVGEAGDPFPVCKKCGTPAIDFEEGDKKIPPMNNRGVRDF